jgi:carboxylesterase
VLTRLLKKWDMPPVYADPSLVAQDTNYEWAPMDAIASLLEFSQVTRQRLPEVHVPTLVLQSRKDSVVAPESADIIYDSIATPPSQKRIVWFEKTEHEMFRDCERAATIQTVVDYVKERSGLPAGVQAVGTAEREIPDAQ